MKRYLAVVLVLRATFLSMKRFKPVRLALSFHEDLDYDGIPVFINYSKEKNITADLCPVGDKKLVVSTGNSFHCLRRCIAKTSTIHLSMILRRTSWSAIKGAITTILNTIDLAKKSRYSNVHDKNYTCPFSPIWRDLIQGTNAVGRMSTDNQIRNYLDEVETQVMRRGFPEAAMELDPSRCYPASTAEDASLTKLSRNTVNWQKIINARASTEAGFFEEELDTPKGGYRLCHGVCVRGRWVHRHCLHAAVCEGAEGADVLLQ